MVSPSLTQTVKRMVDHQVFPVRCGGLRIVNSYLLQKPIIAANQPDGKDCGGTNTMEGRGELVANYKFFDTLIKV